MNFCTGCAGPYRLVCLSAPSPFGGVAVGVVLTTEHGAAVHEVALRAIDSRGCMLVAVCR